MPGIGDDAGVGRYRRAPAMEGWRRDTRIAERGFNHAYDSVVADGNGEDFFADLLDAHLSEESDVLDVGCGHGELTLALARRTRTAVGVDRTPGYIELARELASEADVRNVKFHVVELAGPDEDRPGGPLPLADRSIDVVVDRRGPSIERFIDDLRRVARPGTTIIGMHPAGGPPRPPWADELGFDAGFGELDQAKVTSWVVGPASKRGITSFRLWWIDVPERFTTPRGLYDKVRLPTSAPFDSVERTLSEVIARHGDETGVVLRHQRLVFTLDL